MEKCQERKAVLALQPNPMRLIERHFLEVIAPSEKKLRPARKCYVCDNNDNRKMTTEKELEKKHDTFARTVMLDWA
ncbi:hypothetical protein TNCV_742891 [Trichonephila clavipes]|nr:hypothetical protein TNCV_742891 [Trichonephila clavipes]